MEMRIATCDLVWLEFHQICSRGSIHFGVGSRRQEGGRKLGEALRCGTLHSKVPLGLPTGE